MLNSFTSLPVYNWVKNVYSLCIHHRDNRVNLYTALYPTIVIPQGMGVKLPLFTQVLASFTPQLYTRFFEILPLLIVQLFTLSTPPIISKTN